MLFYDQNGALGQFQGFNNVTHEYRINNIAANGSINFMLGHVSRFQVRPDGDVAISGSLWKGGVPFLHNFGTDNTFLGQGAGNFTMTGTYNAATGASALTSNTTGGANTASGAHALMSNTMGYANTATGANALASNTTGELNTASGASALFFNTTGWYNTASGFSALAMNKTSSENTATGTYALAQNIGGAQTRPAAPIRSTTSRRVRTTLRLGTRAGANATTGSNNIYLGATCSAARASPTRFISACKGHRPRRSSQASGVSRPGSPIGARRDRLDGATGDGLLVAALQGRHSRQATPAA